MAKAKTAARSLEIDAKSFKELVGAVLPFANPKSGLPVFDAVLIEQTGTTITAMATDRYRAGICRAEVASGGEFKTLVSRDDVRQILRIFAPTRRANPSLRFVVDGESLTVEATGGLVSMTEARFGFRALSYKYPAANIKRITLEALTTTAKPAERRALNGHYLADFRHAVRDGEPLVFTEGSAFKPVAVRCGSHFVGVIMSVKLADEVAAAGTADSWRTLLSGDQPEAGAA